MKGGEGSGVSTPRLLKIETLRLAIAWAGTGGASKSRLRRAVPSSDANDEDMTQVEVEYGLAGNGR